VLHIYIYDISRLRVNYKPILRKCTVLLCMEFGLPFEIKDTARVSRLLCNECGGDDELQKCELVT